MRDWNFLSMQAPSDTETTLDPVPGNAAAELYEFPGLFLDTSGAEQAMRSRIQTSETAYETVEAASTVRDLAPGAAFQPQDVAVPDNRFDPQVVLSIRHALRDPTYETTGERPSYANTFTAMPAKTPATPRRTVPRPVIVGQQIALIAGPSGEEIYTEQFGRVKLTFPWDRRAKGDGSDTCWVRVGQPWAGTSWGYQVIPRIGMEALISYQEGDPDRPFVMVLVPDPKNPVPYTLPDNKTRMVVRSNSYKSTGYNEMTFEDATGAENVFFHAQKDHTTRIENNETNSVGANQSQVVGQNQALTVGANKTEEVGGSLNLTVGGTGAGAAALMGPLAGLSGQTAGMLGQALQVAGAGSAGGGGDAGGGGAGLMSALSGLAGMAGGAGGGGLIGMAMGAVGAAGGGMGGILGGVAPQFGSSVLGQLSGGGQGAQGGVANGLNPRSDAGTALAAAGASLAGAAQGLFSQGGVMNTTVGLIRTDSVGMAHAMQVGTSQAVSIGSTKMETIGYAHTHTVGNQMMIDVGDTMQITVGSVFKIVVGQSTLTMDKEGNVTITGTTFTTDFSDAVKHWGKVIDLNPSR